jgi:NAD(P)-dependent dehydrogenase (short-subunit alcohol dehydrogenase family)
MKTADARAVITGGASGLGHAVGQLIVAAGGRVSLLDVNEDRGVAAARTLGSAASFVHCDVASEAQANSAIAAAREHMGGLNLLVNCAGIAGPARLLGRHGTTQANAFTRVVQINLIGTILCDKAAAAMMQNNAPGTDGERGVLIHTSSIAAYEGQIGQVAYTATKAAVAAMTLPIARELAMCGIRCVAIAPGIFRTPMLAAMPQDVQESLARQVPFPQRLGEPQEYARIVQVIFENSMLNGTTIRLDGAIRMQPK